MGRSLGHAHQQIVVQTRKMRKRAKRCVAILATIIVAVGVSITLTVWRYSLYRNARLTIESGDEAEAIRVVTKLHKNPLFGLDWTIHGAVKKIPHGFLSYEKVFGCPSCRGDFYTLLYHSAYNGHEELTRTMIDLGAPLERWNDAGERVLRAAVISRNPAVVKLLIEKGADANARNEGVTYVPVLHTAVMIKIVPKEIIDILLENGADINSTNRIGWTALDVACEYNTDVIPFLIQNGAELGAHKTKSLTGDGEAIARTLRNPHNNEVELTDAFAPKAHF